MSQQGPTSAAQKEHLIKLIKGVAALFFVLGVLLVLKSSVTDLTLIGETEDRYLGIGLSGVGLLEYFLIPHLLSSKTDTNND